MVTFVFIFDITNFDKVLNFCANMQLCATVHHMCYGHACSSGRFREITGSPQSFVVLFHPQFHYMYNESTRLTWMLMEVRMEDPVNQLIKLFVWLQIGDSICITLISSVLPKLVTMGNPLCYTTCAICLQLQHAYYPGCLLLMWFPTRT